MILAALLIAAGVLVAYEVSIYRAARRARMEWQGRRRVGL